MIWEQNPAWEERSGSVAALELVLNSLDAWAVPFLPSFFASDPDRMLKTSAMALETWLLGSTLRQHRSMGCRTGGDSLTGGCRLPDHAATTFEWSLAQDRMRDSADPCTDGSGSTRIDCSNNAERYKTGSCSEQYAPTVASCLSSVE